MTNWQKTTRQIKMAGWHFLTNLFKKKSLLVDYILLNLFPKHQFNNNLASFPVMAWHWRGNKQLADPELTKICDCKWKHLSITRQGCHWAAWNERQIIYFTWKKIWQDKYYINCMPFNGKRFAIGLFTWQNHMWLTQDFVNSVDNTINEIISGKIFPKYWQQTLKDGVRDVSCVYKLQSMYSDSHCSTVYRWVSARKTKRQLLNSCTNPSIWYCAIWTKWLRHPTAYFKTVSSLL